MARRTRILRGDFRNLQERAGRRTALTGIFAAVALLAGVGPASAGAADFGQIGEPWGEVGAGPGQFFNPGMFGVDPDTGDVYTGDLTADKSHYRIQKFTETGGFLAAVEVARSEAGKVPAVHGIAVDPGANRFYVVQGCRVKAGTATCEGSEAFGALHLLAFDMSETGQILELADTFDLPVGADELYEPTAIAADPSTDDILILAEDGNHHKVVQRVHSNGGIGARFTDGANALKPVTGSATTLTVGPDGTAYTITGAGGTSTSAKDTRAWELPSSLLELKQVPGFAAAAEEENWLGHLKSTPREPFLDGPQLAISPDGDTLYWKEIEGTKLLVRGYSLVDAETQVLYGGGAKRCVIQTELAGLGTVGQRLLVFDYGPTGLANPSKKPAFGYRLLTFGPGGTGCPSQVSRTPIAKFTIDGEEGDSLSVGERETVTFDASKSQIRGATRRELVWNFGDGKQEVTKCPLALTEECEMPAAAEVTHKYTSVCECTVTLEMKLEKSTGGDPAPIQHMLKVEFRAPPKMFSLNVSKDGTGTGLVSSDRTGIYCGGVCDREFEENRRITLIPAAAPGSVFAGWSGGCVGSSLCQVTMNAAKSVTATFDAVLPPPLLPALSEGAGASPGAAAAPEKTKPKPQPKPRNVPPGCRKLRGEARARCVAKHRQGKSAHKSHGKPGSRRGSR